MGVHVLSSGSKHLRALPTSLAEKLLQDGNGASAVVLHAMIQVGIKPGIYMNRKQIEGKLSRTELSSSMIYRVLNGDYFNRRMAEKRGRGRRAVEYAIPSMKELFRRVKPEKSTSIQDILPLGAFRNTGTYRKMLHVMFLTRQYILNGFTAVQYARQFLSQRLGVSRNHTWRYEQGLIEVTENIKKRSILFIRGYLADWGLPETPAEAKGWEWLEGTNPDTGEKKLFPAVRAIVAKLAPAGWTFVHKERKPNYYTPDKTLVAFAREHNPHWTTENIPEPKQAPGMRSLEAKPEITIEPFEETGSFNVHEDNARLLQLEQEQNTMNDHDAYLAQRQAAARQLEHDKKMLEALSQLNHALHHYHFPAGATVQAGELEGDTLPIFIEGLSETAIDYLKQDINKWTVGFTIVINDLPF